MSEKPNVTQTKLNIAHNEVRQVSPSDLQPHQKNAEIYGDTDERSDLADDFVESVESKGVLEPLTVNDNGKIVSGHRRWLAAQEAGLATVPVRYESFESDLHEREAVIEFNRQREKTPGQIVNEFEEMLAIEQERAEKERKRKISETQKGKSSETKETFPTSQKDDKQAREKAAEKVNADVSGRTLEKGLKVKQKAEEGDETAQKEWKKLENDETTFHKANRKIKKEQNKQEREEKRNEQKEKIKKDYFGDESVPPALKVGDASDLPLDDETVDLIITSPPYNLGHDDWKMGGEGREARKDGVGYYDDRNELEYQAWQLDVFEELYRVASVGASFFYNHKPRQSDGGVIHPLDWIRDENNPWKLRQEIIWDRKSTHNHSPAIFWPTDERIYWFTKGKPDIPDDGTGMESVWRFHGPKPNTEHPAPFPDELPRRCIESLGTDGDVILDPFGGSMTTCEVAAKLGYESIGVDINPDWVKQKREEWGIDNE